MGKKKNSIKKLVFGKKESRAVLKVNPTVPPQRPLPLNAKVDVFTYSRESFSFDRISNVSTLKKPENELNISWINIYGLSKEEVETVSSIFGIHSLITEDILSIGQRPKMDDLNNLLFCLLNMLFYNEESCTVDPEQISIVLGKNFVLTFQEEGERDVFSVVRDKIKVPGSKIRLNRADFLFYSILDAIVDHYFVVMEKLGDNIETLEDEILRFSNKESLGKINDMRKEMIVLKRNIAPVREMISSIIRSDSEMIAENTEKYFKDVYDHIIQANDLSENYRDLLINLQDLYLNNVNLRLNEVMKVIAIVTCLMAPAAVIGGIFGMNFDRIPLLHNQWGFYISVAIMLLVPVAMVIIFKKRGWF